MTRKTELLIDTFELIRDLSENLPVDQDLFDNGRRAWTYKKSRLGYILILSWIVRYGKQIYELYLTSKVAIANVLVLELLQMSSSMYHLVERIDSAVKDRRVDRLEADIRRFFTKDTQDRKSPIAQNMLNQIESVNRRFSGFFTGYNDLQRIIVPDFKGAMTEAEEKGGVAIDPEPYLEGSQSYEIGAKNFHSALVVAAYCRNRIGDLFPLLEKLCEPPQGTKS